MGVTGLLFGSFNPIHNGHIAIAQYLLDCRLCDEVRLVVSPQNPLKEDATLLPERERLEIVKSALAGRRGMTACDVEFTMPKPSYTIDTLNKLAKGEPERRFALVIGADNLAVFDRWRSHEEIVARWTVFVYPRHGVESPKITHPNIRRIDAPLFPLSSTEIRERIVEGKGISEFVPACVRQQILTCYQAFLCK